jgi:hypothetical protein
MAGDPDSGPVASRFARRRHRRRAQPSESAPVVAPEALEVPTPHPADTVTDSLPSGAVAPKAVGRRPDPMDRVWRDLAAPGPSRVGVSGALRARDVDRPTEEDLAEAERDVVLVRRNWTPPGTSDRPSL